MPCEAPAMVPEEPPRPWLAPVSPGVIERAFHPGERFAAGGHRGIDLRTAPGARVVAPCSSVVTFRGRVGGGPSTLTLDCGTLRATLQRIAPSVGVGQTVRLGAPVGAATGHALDLSARERSGAYVDPAALIGAARRSVPPIEVPRGAGRTARPQPRPVARPAQLPATALLSPVPPSSAAVRAGAPRRRDATAQASTSAGSSAATAARRASIWTGVLGLLGVLIAMTWRRRDATESRRVARRAHLVGARR